MTRRALSPMRLVASPLFHRRQAGGPWAGAQSFVAIRSGLDRRPAHRAEHELREDVDQDRDRQQNQAELKQER